MKITISFLQGIGHKNRVYIRGLPPKNIPLPELQARGMTYTNKDGEIKRSIIKGYISLDSGEFCQIYGEKDKPKSFPDGWGYLKSLNQQGYGIYFGVHHGGDKSTQITHGSVLFHESDRASFEEQQREIDRITQEFGKPTAVVKTRKSLHGYWASEIIRIDRLATDQRRWIQYSKCDDGSLDDLAQLMRLPGFYHISWNAQTQELDRVFCELLQLNDVRYSLEQFDRVLPELDLDRWCRQSVIELNKSDAGERDMRSLAPYLQGYDNSGRWIKAKCPAHNGESSDSLHIDSETGGFICHAGCKTSAVYNATKAIAVAAGHRFEVVSVDEYLKESINKALDLKNCKAPILFGGKLGTLLNQIAKNFNERVEIFNFISIPVLASRIPAETSLLVNPGSGFVVKPIRWCGLVGSTGTKKSPILNTVIKPLNAQQKAIWTQYQNDIESYNKSLREYERLGKEEQKKVDEPLPPKPMQSVYFSDFTIEALISAVSEYPDQGTIVSVDELAGFFSSMDAYKSSAGVDRPKWLSIWDGGAIKSTRRTGSTYVPHSSISILGGIQPGIIENMIKKDKSKADGLWPRFTFMRIAHNITDLFTEIDGSLDETLRKIYALIGDEPSQQHTIDIKARPLCAAWHEFLQQKMLDEGDNNPLMVGVYAKMIGITFRNALILHRVYAAISTTVPTSDIPLSTIDTAIAWTKFEMNQTLLEYQMLGLTDDNDPELARILKFINKFGGDTWLHSNPDGWVSARDVIHWWSPKPKPNAEDARKFMNKVVTLGYASSNDEASGSSDFKIKVNPQKCGDSGNKNEETQQQSHSPGFDDLVTEISQDILKPLLCIGSGVVTTENGGSGNSGNNSNDEPRDVRDLVTTVTTCYQADLKSGNRDKDYHSNGCGDLVTTVTTFSRNNLKIGEACASSSDDRVKLGEDIITVEADILHSGDLKLDHRGVVQIIQPSPRNAITYNSGRIEVDIDRLALNYQPSVPTPSWEPNTHIKPYEELTKLYLDIETTGLDAKVDRVLMVGLLNDRGVTTIITDTEEKTLLAQTIEHLKQHQPECLIGHNLINFDLPFLADRCQVHNITYPFRKGNKTSRITSSSVNGKPIEFTPIYWSGVNILDTYQQIAIWDKQAAKLDRYDLKSSVIALGLRDDRRLELSVNQIRECWESGDTKTIENYLKFDLDDTQLLAEFLLPVVYYQLAYVPALSFQQIAIASPALKAQKIHEKLLPRLNPIADEPLKYDGGKVELVAPGLHKQVAKIDVSSLYPSIMLRYGICSRKDTEHKFLGALAYMVDARLKLKALAKSGDKSAAFQEKSLKILINGSYGFMGTGFYTFNDYEAAALVTAYGRKILDLMVEVVTNCGGVVIEIDTDGILFSHDDPETVKGLVSGSLPTGINIDLELANCGLYAPKAKSYVIVHPNGKTTVKGLFRKRNRYPLENKFPIEFLRLYFIESPQAAEEYYHQTRSLLVDRRIDVADLTINRKIGSAEKNLVELGIGKPGDRVSYWFTEGKRHHAKTGKVLPSHPLETTIEPYWTDYYIGLLDGQYKSILGSEKAAEIMPKLTPIQLAIAFD